MIKYQTTKFQNIVYALSISKDICSVNLLCGKERYNRIRKKVGIRCCMNTKN
jgi:hypothetical protein